MNFVAIDFETANRNYASICQVGVVVFQDGQVVDSFETLINPRTTFDDMNIKIHKITPDMVRSAPSFPAVYPRIRQYLTGQTVVCHTHFDRTALHRALAVHNLPQIDCRWLDTCDLSRNVWPHLPKHGLKPVAKHLGIKFAHHNACEDARACGEIVTHAINHAGVDIGKLSRPYKPQIRQPRPPTPVYRATIDLSAKKKKSCFGTTATFLWAFIAVAAIYGLLTKNPSP